MKRLRGIYGIVLFLLVCGLVFNGVLSAADTKKDKESKRGKTMQIGKINWYTEQNTFDEMIKIAQKEKKPILTVFSATWCGPCQKVKKETFSKDEFQKVADQVVLLYIEQTDPKSKDYIKKNKISAYPTFKVFSKDGIDLETGSPERTVEGFLNWVKDIKAGNSYYELSRRLKKEPNNREVIMKLVDKVAWDEVEERVKLLRQALKLNPDVNDPVSHKAYEKLAADLYMDLSMMGEDKKAKADYAKKHNDEFMNVIKAYYPDKFQHALKGPRGLSCILGWFNALGKYKDGLFYFENFLKTKKNKLDIQKDMQIFPDALTALLNANQGKKADEWLKKLQDMIKKEAQADKDKEADAKKKSGFYFYMWTRIYHAFVEYYGEKQDAKNAEKYAGLMFEEYTKNKRGQFVDYIKVNYAKKYLLFAEELIKKFASQIKTAKGQQLADTTQNLAAIYAKMGKPDKAKKYLYDLYENKDLMESFKPKQKSRVLNGIAWTMVEAKLVDKKTLEIAKESVKLHENSMNLDTLACVHADLGNFEEAIKWEEKAIKKATQYFMVKEFSRKMDKWKKALK